MKNVIIIITIALLLCNCHSATKVVTVHDTSIDTLYVATHSTDSIYIHDSINTLIKGDSVLIDRWHTKYKYVYMNDTVYQHKVDSIPVVVEVPVQVKYVPWYAKLLSYIGIVCLGFFGIFCYFKIKNFI